MIIILTHKFQKWQILIEIIGFLKNRQLNPLQNRVKVFFLLWLKIILFRRVVPHARIQKYDEITAMEIFSNYIDPFYKKVHSPPYCCVVPLDLPLCIAAFIRFQCFSVWVRGVVVIVVGFRDRIHLPASTKQAMLTLGNLIFVPYFLDPRLLTRSLNQFRLTKTYLLVN